MVILGDCLHKGHFYHFQYTSLLQHPQRIYAQQCSHLNIDITLGDDLGNTTTAIFEDSKETLDNSLAQIKLDEGLILPTVEAYINDASIISH